MFSRLKKHHKLCHILNIFESETQISIIFSLLILVVFTCLFDSYNKIFELKEALQAVIGVIIGGFIALTGLALSGVAIVTSLFSRIHIDIIEEDKPESVENILVSFEYLGFISSIVAVYLALLYIGMSFLIPINVVIHYLLVAATSYLVLFVLFYAVALTGNCIRLYNIKIKADQIYELKLLLKQMKNDMKNKDTP